MPTSACGEATCDELWLFMWLSLLIAVCLVEFTGLHSN